MEIPLSVFFVLQSGSEKLPIEKLWESFFILFISVHFSFFLQIYPTGLAPLCWGKQRQQNSNNRDFNHWLSRKNPKGKAIFFRQFFCVFNFHTPQKEHTPHYTTLIPDTNSAPKKLFFPPRLSQTPFLAALRLRVKVNRNITPMTFLIWTFQLFFFVLIPKIIFVITLYILKGNTHAGFYILKSQPSSFGAKINPQNCLFCDPPFLGCLSCSPFEIFLWLCLAKCLITFGGGDESLSLTHHFSNALPS